MNEIQQHTFYMDISKRTAELSHAQRNKVGAILVKENSILSYGFNGTPHGFNNICEDENNITKNEVIHAELNCIIKCAKLGISINDSILYVTLSPCIECAKLIAQSGISTVIYDVKYRIFSEPIELLEKCGVKVYKYDELINIGGN